MNTINVTVELGPESMAKLDKILEALQGQHHNCQGCTESMVQVLNVNTESDTGEGHPDPVGEPGPMGVPGEGAPAGQPEPAAAPEPEAPKYTKADVMALVQKLAAPNNPAREKAKAIVKSYGAKVSDIPEAKYGEVMDKLTALDKEG